MKEEVKNDVVLNNLALPRYIKVKDSINDLLEVIDREKVEIDGKDRFLNALLQLIKENDGKTVDEKYDDITDAIYNGNIFSNYFEEQNKKLAVEILSQTSLLNKEEELIYKVNFLMPDDQDFIKIYTGFGKNSQKILQAYNLKDSDLGLLVARATEIAKFFQPYQEEKERVFALKVSDVVKNAIENPTEENIIKAKESIGNLSNDELKHSLENQLREVEQDVAVEEPKLLDPQTLKAGFASLGNNETFVMKNSLNQEKKGDDHSNMTLDDLIAQTDDNLEPITNSDIEIPALNKADKEVGISDELTEEPELLLSDDKVPVDEEKIESDAVTTVEQSEDKKSDDPIVSPEGEKVGQDVMSAIQNIVASAKDNAKRVENLETEIGEKDENINRLNSIVSEQEQQINSYQLEIKNKDIALEQANSVVKEQESLLANQDAQISSLTATLNAYKKAYAEIQHLVASAQSQVLVPDDTVQKKV